MGIRDRVASWLGAPGAGVDSGPASITVDDLPTASAPQRPTSPISGIGYAPAQLSIQDGDKFPGGFGVTELWLKDYWTLRARSAQLFESNLYARGLIRRLITNEINTGLTLEAFPDEGILGYEDGELDDWSESTENRFRLWCSNPALCDYYGQETFWQLQATARREALIEGDILVVMRQATSTRLPQIQLVSGRKVVTPQGANQRRGAPRIEHGVELDDAGRHVAYHVTDRFGESKRIPARGRSGRRMAWLVYGADKRHGAVRGDPMLGIVLQSLRELDRYRDAAQRKAVINSILAMFIEKNEDKQGTMPLTGGATRRDRILDDQQGAQGERRFDIQGQVPGLVIEELQQGETPKSFGPDGTDVNYPAFEAAILHALAWTAEVPPEILQLAFSNNYSASQAAINEFKSYLNRVRQDIGKGLCQPVYEDWLLSEVLLQRVDAPGLLEAWRDPMQYDTWGGWIQSDWTGAIKPSTDLVKQARGHGLLLDRGLTTHSRATAEITGTSFNRNIKRLRREHEQLARAMEPIQAMEREDTTGRGDEVADNPRTQGARLRVVVGGAEHDHDEDDDT